MSVTINVLADWCEQGVRIVSVTQQIDLTGHVGRMVASVMFGLAEIELEYRRERQAAGANRKHHQISIYMAFSYQFFQNTRGCKPSHRCRS